MVWGRIRQEAYFIFCQTSSYFLNPGRVLAIEADSSESCKIALLFQEKSWTSANYKVNAQETKLDQGTWEESLNT